MQLRRVKHLFSSRRLRACKSLFRHPWQSHLGLAFLGRKPVPLTLQSGQTLHFSRDGRDHLFWDWYLNHGPDALEFTADGEIRLSHHGREVLLRPGTTDFFIFKEIFLRDEYGLGTLPASLDTVVDLGGNVGLFTCAVLPRARRVITVEPVLANYRQAAKNIDLNGGQPADLLRYAVTGRSGDEVTIHLSGRNTGMNSLYAGWVEKGGVLGQEKVPTLSLPDLLDKTGCGEIDLLKCDIEGAEFDVFQAAPSPVLRRIRRIVMEVHVSDEHPRSAMESLTAQLRLARFELSCEKLGRRAGTETWFLKAQRQPQPTFACRG